MAALLDFVFGPGTAHDYVLSISTAAYCRLLGTTTGTQKGLR